MITIGQARRDAAARLSAAGIDTAALDARVLLAHVLGVTSTMLLVCDPDPIEETHLTTYQQVIEQRATGIPVAYLIGEREFMGLSFRTSPDVLVPRPDTEPLVEWGLAWLADHTHAVVADIGTGSGAIAISIAAHAPQPHRVIATDTSDGALHIARANADALLPAHRRSLFELRSGNLTAALDAPVDLLLTNLPYLTPDQIAGNPHLDHEPRLALDGGPDGLHLVREVIADLHRVLIPHGAVGFEIDPAQADTVQALLCAALPHHHIRIVPDIAGDARHVVAFYQRP